MPRFFGYTTYDSEDVVVLTEEEAKECNMNEIEWADYVWFHADTKTEAYAGHAQAMDAYEADHEAGRPIKDTY